MEFTDLKYALTEIEKKLSRARRDPRRDPWEGSFGWQPRAPSSDSVHGRLKVRTTAEQEEARRKKETEKSKAYKAVTGKIFEKVSNAEYDAELNSCTYDLLQNCADHGTMWNIRKRLWDRLVIDPESEEARKFYDNEVQMTAQVLRSNPKSYGAWKHRAWVQTKWPNPDWTRELSLCGKMLEADERNFHCWDYRRFTCQQSNASKESELKFTRDKIAANFSNFSSWHYRSSLLQPMDDKQFEEELSLVTNAMFTDPADQSAWLYLRWLLQSRQNRMTGVYVDKANGKMLLRVAKPMKADQLGPVMMNEKQVDITWKDNASPNIVLEGTFPPIDEELCTLSVAGECIQFKEGQSFVLRYRTDFSAVVQKTLQNIEELLELEPDNKWCHLSIIDLYLLYQLPECRVDLREKLNRLLQFDPMRKEYYNHLGNLMRLSEAIASSVSTSLSLRGLSLSSLGAPLTHMVFLEKLDLSNNNLTSVEPLLSCMPRLQCLVLDHNQLRSIRALRALPSLCELSVCHNEIDSADEIQAMQEWPQLTAFNFEGNPEKSSDSVAQ